MPFSKYKFSITFLLILLFAFIGSAIASTNVNSEIIWQQAGDLNQGRYNALDTILNDGRVLIVGGYNAIGDELTTEIYNPLTNTWSTVGNLNQPRIRGFSTIDLLTDGRVIVVGGFDSPGTYEIYDPLNSMWSIHNLNTQRTDHASTMLQNGKLLISGGSNNTSIGQASAELFDPNTNSWSTVQPMNHARVSHSLTTMSNGKVLVFGRGMILTSPNSFIQGPSVETYDPTSDSWTTHGHLETSGLDPYWVSPADQPGGRHYHSAIALSNGEVLIFGGGDSNFYQPYTAIDIYNPITDSWRHLGPSNGFAYQTYPEIIELSDNRILLGMVDLFTNSPIMYDLDADTFTFLDTINYPRSVANLTNFGNDRILIAGGFEPNLTNPTSRDLVTGTEIFSIVNFNNKVYIPIVVK